MEADLKDDLNLQIWRESYPKEETVILNVRSRKHNVYLEKQYYREKMEHLLM